MKKLLTAIAIVLILVTVTACNMIDTLMEGVRISLDNTVETVPFMEVVPKELSYSEGYTPVVSRYSYDALPLEGERRLYTELLDAYYDISADIDSELNAYPMPQIKLDGFSLSEAEVRTVMKAVSDDCPEIFWPIGTIGYYSDGESTIMQGYSRYSPEEIGSRLDALHEEADAFYATVPDGLSAYERELMVHDYLLARTAYDTDVDKVNLSANHPDIYTAYGAMVKQDAVCEGYARAFQMLLNGLGVDCVSVIGTGADEMHIWNAVKLDEDWYNVDVTWDDQEEVYGRYLYFNVTDDALYSDHTPSPLFTELNDDEINGEGDYSADVMNLFIPACNDDTMGYYCRDAAHLEDYDGAAVKTALLTAAEKREEYYCFYIDKSLDYDDALSVLFTDYPQYFFDYVSDVNNYLPDYSIDNSNLSYFPLRVCRAVAVQLNYY